MNYKPAKSVKPKLCKTWPKCRCVARGRINAYGECGTGRPAPRKRPQTFLMGGKAVISGDGEYLGTLVRETGYAERAHPSMQRLAGYDVREGGDGKVGIYVRDYNVRLAVFNAGTTQLQDTLRILFNRSHDMVQAVERAGSEAEQRRRKLAPKGGRAVKRRRRARLLPLLGSNSKRVRAQVRAAVRRGR